MKRKIRKELWDELLAGYEKPEDLTGPHGLLKQLTGDWSNAHREPSSPIIWATSRVRRKARAAATRGTGRVRRRW